MDFKQLLELNAKRNICQIGFVCYDAEKTARDFVERLHIGPWRFVSLCNETVPDMQLLHEDGILRSQEEPFKYICALCNLENIQLELIQPVYGKTIYDEFLKEKGEGLHHIKEKISPDCWDAHIQSLIDKDMPVILAGTYGLAKFCYVDSTKHVCLQMELGDNIPNPTFPEGSEVHYYPEKPEDC